jgi:hypothetical protein
MNMRNIHQEKQQAGNIGHSQLNQGYIQDIKNAIPDMNMRNIHQEKQQAGNIGHSQLNQGYIQDIKNAIPDITLREIHSDTKHIKPAKYQKVDALRTREDISNALLNNTKEKISIGRAPTNSNYSRGPLFDASTYQLCDPLLIVNRTQYPDTKQITTERLPFLQKIHEPLPQQSKYVNKHIETSLQGNPFINNLVYVSQDDNTVINLKLDKIISKNDNISSRSWN